MIRNTVLITGGSGYIGSHVTKALITGGYMPVIMDIRAPLPDHAQGAVYVRGDVAAPKDTEAAFSVYHPKYAIHLAAQMPDCGASETTLQNVNGQGTRNVVRFAAKYQCRRIIFTSSAAVYGNGTDIQEETDQCRPISLYGKSKLTAEHECARGAVTGKLSIVVLRLFNVIGIGTGMSAKTYAHKQTTLPAAILRVLSQQSRVVALYGNQFPTGDGYAVRDYIHVSDVVDAILCAMRYRKQSKTMLTVNVGSGNPISTRELVRAFERASKKHIAVRVAPPRKEDIAYSVADTRSARAHLKWKPQRSAIPGVVMNMCTAYGIC